MDFKKIKLIISREFIIRVRKKSFILVTFLTPVMLALMFVLPTLLMTVKDGTEKTIMVIDRSGIAEKVLTSQDDVHYQFALPDTNLEQVKNSFADSGLYAVCLIDTLDGNLSVRMYSPKQINMDVSSNIANALEEEVEALKLSAYGIPDLDSILKEIKTDIHVKTILWDEEGGEKENVVAVNMVISYIASFLIYMFIFMYGSMIIRGVIEEKTTRIVEVVISSVKPIELMMGKIFGVALVALIQFFLWIVLAVILVATAVLIIGPETFASIGGNAPQANDAISSIASSDMMGGVLTTLQGLHIGYILVCFVTFFILGYLLYASMFAAIGSVSDTETETQQFQLPVTIPLILGLFIMMHTFQYPDSTLSFWASIIPFTSPMVMLARVPFGVPFWQLALSIVLLFATFVGIAYFSAKIYRVGILMYGKKVTWKELWKWMHYKN